MRRLVATIDAHAPLAIWLRLEPTADMEARRGPRSHFLGLVRTRFCDVVAYGAPPSAGGQERKRWSWHDPDRPRKGCKTVVLGRFTWRAIWLPDLKG